MPGLTLDSGEKISGSRAILRRLEEVAPEPSLFPADPEARAEVERAEEWGDEVWQPMARRLLWTTFAKAPGAMVSYQDGSRLPRLPAPAVRALAPFVVPVERRLNAAREGAVRADLSPCPATSTASTAGSPTACSAARRSTPPTCRSPRPRG